MEARLDEAADSAELKAELAPLAAELMSPARLEARLEAPDWRPEGRRDVTPPTPEVISPPMEDRRELMSWLETTPAAVAATNTVEKRMLMGYAMSRIRC
jgi:hypothetical protein